MSWPRGTRLTRMPTFATVDDYDAYEAQVADYRSGASTAKFPLGTPPPLDLIARITRLHVEQRQI
jgi:hypothetical protein